MGEKVRATVVDESPDSYFVEYGDGEHEIEPKTEKNRILFETDLVENPSSPVVDVAGHLDDEEVIFTGYLNAGDFYLSVNGDEITLTADQAFEVLSIVADDSYVQGDDEFQTFDVLIEFHDYELGWGAPADGQEITVEARTEKRARVLAKQEVNFDVEFSTVYEANQSAEIDVSDREREAHSDPLLDAWTDDEVSGAGDSDDLKDDISESTTRALYDLYYDILADRVRTDVVNSFLPRFGGATVDDAGWVINDTVLVTYEAENYLLEDVDAHVVEGSGTREADDTHEFLSLRFDTETEIVSQVDDFEETLTEREQEFLATVEVLSFPREYLGQDLINKVEQAYEDRPDTVADLASSASVDAFMDPHSGLVHRHSLSKHTISATFSVNQWVVDELEFSGFDHAAVWEMKYREDEFRDDDRKVFWDTTNDDDERWRQIKNVCPNAPIPDRVHNELKSRYN